MSKFLLTSSLALAGLLAGPVSAQTALSDQPVLTVQSVPGNLALALSVEFPTALGVAYNTTYTASSTYRGYFDPAKCYTYNYNSSTPGDSYFQPAGLATSAHVCSNQWSGNFLNWATMQTIDPFRWALTGGFRPSNQDTASLTVLERAYASGQGGTAPVRTASTSTSVISGATPTGWSKLYVQVSGMGAKFRINNVGTTSGSTLTGSAADMTGNAPTGSATTSFDIYARVRVCDNSAGAGGLESNCKQYGTSYKPEGLIQQYSDRIRFSAFGYLVDSSLKRDGGVMRARMKYVGPTQPVPGSTPITNPLAEWSTVDGTMLVNPDATDASTTASAYGVAVSNSGVMNYLNKFGSITRSGTSYKTNDPVGELYYATLRYYRNLGNVPEWSNAKQTNANATTADITTYVDGFPVITTWDDPILYSCQKNFVLGIGDENTHADRNVPGNTSPSSSEPAKPAKVTADTSVDAATATNAVGTMAGISGLAGLNNYPRCCDNNGALMAGLAYDANTTDIRPDDPNNSKTLGRQSVQTYWLDVLESGFYTNNQFYLAAKYGGFTVPDGFKPYAQTSDIPQAWWHSGDSTDTVSGTASPGSGSATSQLRPDNYYTANRPDLMISGLTSAFASIASKLKAFTTSFSTSLSQVNTGALSTYAAQYDAKTWTGEVVANTTAIADGATSPTMTEAWRFSTKLAAQAGGSGWDTGRVMITYNTATKAGVPFRNSGADATGISTAQATALDPSYSTASDASNYLNYLRGDRSQEANSTVSGSTKAYRIRDSLLGDVVNAKAVAVAPPAAPYSADTNAGYAEFKTTTGIANRVTMVFAAANDGMLHAIDGSLTGTTAGKELFAYVPGALYTGPNATPNIDGLAALGNPNFNHHYYVDATPVAGDVDFAKTGGNTDTPDWHTILVGGLGKGGRSIYALDITQPSAFANETSAAAKVLWEFSEADLGFTFGQPSIVKTKKYGWVVVFGSGYNNASGGAYLYLVNPKTGALIKKISTGITSGQVGLAYVQPFLLDITDGTADSVYAGDLLGNLWRFDLTDADGNYPNATKIATLTDGSNNALSVTSRPLVVIQPKTYKRWVTVGTGRLLASSDIGSTQIQSYFAIVDGTAARPNQSTNLPSGVTFPIPRGKLKPLTDLSTAISVDYTTQMGWVLDLTSSMGGGSGWRIVSDSSTIYGSVIFGSVQPSTAGSNAACNTSGNSSLYVIDLGTGQSQLTSTANDGTVTKVPYIQQNAVITDIVVIGDPNPPSGKGPQQIAVIGLDNGNNSMPQISKPSALPFTQLNWREIPIKN